jgi:predicted DNA helicase
MNTTSQGVVLPQSSPDPGSEIANETDSDPNSLSSFIALGRRVIDAERAAELQSLSRAKFADGSPQLARMRVKDTASGLGATALLALEPVNGMKLALGHRELSSGDFVQLSSSGLVAAGKDDDETSDVRGTVWRITPENIIVSVDTESLDSSFLDAKRIRVQKRGNDITFKRQRDALTELSSSGIMHPVADVLFGGGAPLEDQDMSLKAAAFLEQRLSSIPSSLRLNEFQREAVIAAVSSSQVTLIHGPPGTGKTMTMAHAISACVRLRAEKVLACAPSNIAADTLLERVLEVDPSLRCVRVGNPARLLDTVLDCSLDSLLHDEFSSLGRQIHRDISVAQKSLWRSGAKRDERAAARAMLKELRKELRQRERSTMRFILEGADVVVTTCAGAADRRLVKLRNARSSAGDGERQDSFDVCFLDEAAQAVEPLAWCALLRARRCVLAGDDCQLPPTILTEVDDLRNSALNLTAFSRAKRVLGKSRVHVLRRQYRMHAVIGQFSSEQFYDRKLIHDETVADRSLFDLVKSRATIDNSSSIFMTDLSAAIVFIDTCGCDFYETTESAETPRGTKKGSSGPEDDSGSRLNEGEAGIVLAHVQNLLGAGVAPDEISVITPYAAQCRRLRNALSDGDLAKIECGTVDSYQGRENEVIIFSATRSSEQGGKDGVGFLGDSRRFNVAVTRAKKSFTLIGDSATLSNGHPTLARFIEYVERRTLADYRSAFSYM